MATGPEHYAEAVRLMKAVTTTDGNVLLGTWAETTIAAAAVHATLAQAAAVALASFAIDNKPVGMAPADFLAWDLVAGEGES